MYYFNIAHLLKPSETSVLPQLRVSVDFRVIKCGFQEKVSWDTDPSCQPKVFGDLRQWRVVVLKEVRLRPVCWSLLIGWGKKNLIIHSQETRQESHYQNYAQLFDTYPVLPPQECGSWRTLSEITGVDIDVNRYGSGQNTVGWRWSKEDPTIFVNVCCWNSQHSITAIHPIFTKYNQQDSQSLPVSQLCCDVCSVD